MLLDEHGVQRGAEILLVAEAGGLDGGDRVEHRAGADRQAGVAQRAGEMQDVLGQGALRTPVRFRAFTRTALGALGL